MIAVFRRRLTFGVEFDHYIAFPDGCNVILRGRPSANESSVLQVAPALEVLSECPLWIGCSGAARSCEDEQEELK